jgi:uncharacterized iron-regulated membrane protein
MWVKLLWGLMGLSGGFLSVTGFVIYVLRKRKAKSRKKVIGEEQIVSAEREPELVGAAS